MDRRNHPNPSPIPAQPESAIAAAYPHPHDGARLPQLTPTGRQPWIIQAYLRDELTSATAKSGQPITAVVAEPVYNADHTIAVPQGATIIGAITNAKPAKSFARAGALGFDFKQIVLPTARPRTSRPPSPEQTPQPTPTSP